MITVRLVGAIALLACVAGASLASAGERSGVQPGERPSDGGLARLGDQAAYSTWNASAERWVYGVELRDADTGRLLTAASRTNPWIAGSRGWAGYGALYLPDNRVRIPQRVSISWWFDQAAAQRRDPASRQGPYILGLRGRLSERALRAAARAERRFMLEIGVGAGVVPPVLRWHLRDRKADVPGGVVERGGDEVDWRPTSWR